MTDTTTRPPRAEEATALIAICEETAMFTAEELEGFSAQIEAEAADGTLAQGWRVAVDAQDQPFGAFYMGPEQMADRIWNLWFIGVRSKDRGRGIGRALVQAAILRARDNGARLLIVETSSLDRFAPARGLYASEGFTEEGRIRHWYGPGEAKVIFAQAIHG